jgi:hypothetical protein
MSRKDVLKVLIMFAAAAVAVALFCYARVDLGMSLEQVTAKLEAWTDSIGQAAIAVWTVIIGGALWSIVSLYLRSRAGAD